MGHKRGAVAGAMGSEFGGRVEWVWMSIWVYRFRLRQCSTSAAVKNMGHNGNDMRTWQGEPACSERSALALRVLVELPVKSSIMVWLEWKIQRFTLLNRRSREERVWLLFWKKKKENTSGGSGEPHMFAEHLVQFDFSSPVRLQWATNFMWAFVISPLAGWKMSQTTS